MTAGIGDGPLATEVRMLHGAPALFINGRPDTGLMFWHTKPDVGREEIGKFAEQGVHLVSTGFSASGCLKEDGSYDFSHIDRMMERDGHQKYPAFFRSSMAASEALSSAREPRSVTRATAVSAMISSTLSAGDSTHPVLMMSPIVRTRTTSSSTCSPGFGGTRSLTGSH